MTFKEPDAAMRACVDAAPVIDGRRANCNLASLGVQRSKPSTPKHGTVCFSSAFSNVLFHVLFLDETYPEFNHDSQIKTYN